MFLQRFLKVVILWLICYYHQLLKVNPYSWVILFLYFRTFDSFPSNLRRISRHRVRADHEGKPQFAVCSCRRWLLFVCHSRSTNGAPSQQGSLKGCNKKAINENIMQIQGSGLCQTSLELWLKPCALVRRDLNETFGLVDCWHIWHQTRNAYKEEHFIPTVKYSDWSGMLSGCFTGMVQGFLVRSIA